MAQRVALELESLNVEGRSIVFVDANMRKERRMVHRQGGIGFPSLIVRVINK
ncbi:hypothetical protein HanRHA438_Chr00c21g0852381 [Helianthus annuus]|nr:hypothetical protein HanRHA438_Chr00c21g0852381 [Helianthus annuus]